MRKIAFSHQAQLYRGSSEYLAGVNGFVEAGQAAGEQVMVALPTPNLDMVPRSLRSVDGVRFVDMIQLGRNPGRIIPAMAEFAAEQGDRPCRFVGETDWPGRSAAERSEIARHDALLALALADCQLAVLSLYDLDSLPPEAVEQAWRTHSEVIVDGVARPSTVFSGAHHAARDDAWPLPDGPPERIVRELAFDDLAALREVVQAKAAASGLIEDRVDDVVLAVNEVASNSILYGGGEGVMSMWCDEDYALICEIRDRGRITDPLVGRYAPGRGLEARGLWLVNQLCDLVQIRSGPGGTTVRMAVCR